MTPRILHVVSVSGGKDSTACLLLALRQWPGRVIAVFADTGHEHEATLPYVEALCAGLNVPLKVVRADFTDRYASKRAWIETKWREHGVAEDRVRRALELLKPTGNPFLDLMMLKGRFPSRMAQFCTQELKVAPLTEWQMGLIDDGHTDRVWSWQGVRRDESLNRASAAAWEPIGAGIYAWRPIVDWTGQQTVDFVRACGVALNPLYSQGMSRVGCMPCINVSKAELAEIARRFPEHIERLAEWERLVAQCSKRGVASFFPAQADGRGALRGADVVSYVKWAKTFRGGKVADPKWDEPAPSCASSYGLCG